MSKLVNTLQAVLAHIEELPAAEDNYGEPTLKACDVDRILRKAIKDASYTFATSPHV